MMNDSNFLASLQQFPKENITDEDCELLAPYTDHPLFTVEFAAKASGLAVGLCKWVKAMKVKLSFALHTPYASCVDYCFFVFQQEY